MKRGYVQNARARAAEETGERIIAAAFARFLVSWYDDVTLDQIAADANVTVQTVIRRFGSKEGVLRAIAESEAVRVQAERATEAGDLGRAVDHLVDHYERIGDVVMHLLRQEQRVAPYAEMTAEGRRVHLTWCRSVFAPWLDGRTGVDRRRREAQLVAICDVYTWHVLRRQQGLSRRQVELAMTEMLNGVLS